METKQVNQQLLNQIGDQLAEALQEIKNKDKIITELTKEIQNSKKEYQKLQESFDKLQNTLENFIANQNQNTNTKINTKESAVNSQKNTNKRKNVSVALNDGKKQKPTDNNGPEWCESDTEEMETNETDNSNNATVSNDTNDLESDDTIEYTNEPIRTFAEVVNNALPYDANQLLRRDDRDKNIKTNRKVSPIEVSVQNNEQRASLHTLLLHNVNIDCFKITNTRTSSKICPSDENTRVRIMNVLDTNEIPFVTFTPKDKQPHAFLMRGLPHDSIDATELLNIFTGNGIQVLKVEQFSTGYTRLNGTSSNLWKIICPHNVDLDELQHVKYIYNTSVRFEILKRKGAIQCHKCQGFMHTAANCHREYKCVKCGKSHEVGQCTVKDAKKLKCANCGKNHTANNLTKCEYFLREILPLSKKNRVRQTEKPKHITNSNNKSAKPTTSNLNGKRTEPKPNNNLYDELNKIEERITNKIMQLISAGLQKNSNPNGAKKTKKQKKSKNGH